MRRSRIVTLALALALGHGPLAAARPAAAAPAPAVTPEPARSAPLPIAGTHPQLHGIDRQVELAFPAKVTPRVRALVGRVGLRIDVALPTSALVERLDAVEAPWQVHAQPIAGGTRIDVVHPTRAVL